MVVGFVIEKVAVLSLKLNVSSYETRIWNVPFFAFLLFSARPPTFNICPLWHIFKSE